MMQNKIIEIIEFTDPVCTWCWGSEPLLRKLETKYGEQLKVKFIMGGLVKDIRSFYDSMNGIGGSAEQSNQQIASHWEEASERHGMPIGKEGFHLFSDEYPSTYPQNIAYKAAQMEDQELADKFLRRLREASEVEAKVTSKKEVLIELASEVGLNIAKFIGRLSDGSAEAAFQEDLTITRKYGVRGFPTFLVRYGEKEILMRGYTGYEDFEAVINTITDNSAKQLEHDKSEDGVLKFINKYGRVAPVEIQVSFDLSKNETEEVINNLKQKNMIKVLPAGNGVFIEPEHNSMFCDPESGVCSI